VTPDEWIYLALVVILPVMQPLNVQIGRHIGVPADVLSVVAIAGLALAVLTRHRRLRWCSWYWYLGFYVIALVASTVWSQDVRRSALKLAGVLNLVGLAVLTTSYVTSTRALRRAIAAWLVGLTVTVAAALLGVVLFVAGVTGSRNIFLYSYGSLPPGPYPRVMALFMNANMLCTYVVAGTMVLLAARAAGWVSRRVFVMLLAGSLVTALFSLSPGLGGLALALAIWYAASLRERAPGFSRLLLAMGWTGAVVMLVAVMISPLGLAGQTTAGWRIAPSSRVLTWIGAWRTFAAHPWLGRGLGLDAADVQYLNAAGMESLTDAHNTWLSILAQQGIIGAVAFALLVLHLIRRLRPFVVKGSELAIVRTGLQLAIVGGFLYQSLSGSFENTRHIWVLMGLAASAQSLSDAAPHATVTAAT
jgi:O-antigen ligase